ncbi:MAG: WXG100 family type VII secretion target [Rhodococcus sp.]|nr:WXG100 family type VII secretion target [Rhodococcus sp. (in: high G+C Gram-positive bacteria)]
MGLSADRAQIDASANHVESVRDNVDGQIAQIRSLVEGSRASWKGEAQTAFANLMERYDASARKQSTALTTIIENIREGNKGYDTTEQASLQAINNAGQSATLDM